MSTKPITDPIVFVSAFMPRRNGAIYAYRFDLLSGKLRRLHQTTDVENPFFIAIAANGHFLYVIEAEQFGGEQHEFVAYSIDGHDGKLIKLNRQSSLGTASCYLDVDPTGKCVVVANYRTGSLAARRWGAMGLWGKPVHSSSIADPAFIPSGKKARMHIAP